jgi:hypothetical protein
MSIKVFSRLYQVDTITSDGTYLYYTNGSSISRLKISTKEIVDSWNTTLITSKYEDPQKLYYHNNVLYATNNKTLKSINVINGETDGVPTTLKTMANNLFGIVVNGDYLYFSDQTKIYKLTLTNNNHIDFATKTVTGADYLTVYDNNLYVSSENTINRYNLTTGALSTWTLSNLPAPKGIHINNGILYILNNTNNKLSTVDLTLETPTVVTFEDISTNNARDLVCVDNILYIANKGLNNLLSFDTNIPTNIPTFITFFSGLLGDPVSNNSGMCFLNDIYISNYTNDTDDLIYKVNNTITGINTGIVNVIGMCCDSTNIYLSSLNSIYKITTTGTTVQSFNTTTPAINMAIKGDDIYFTTTLDTIYKLNLSTTSVSDLNTLSPSCDGITILDNILYICCSDGVYKYNTVNNIYSKLINITASKITNDGTYLYFSSEGNIYKSTINGTYSSILSYSTTINGLIYTDKLYYLEGGILYSYVLSPIIYTLSPQSGDPGSTCVINGVNLSNVNSVYFGTNSINYQKLSDFSIRITIPIGNDNVNVFVSSPTGYSDTLVYNLPTSYSICFLANTLIQTDQGKVNIEKIDTRKHTIQKQKIVAITKTRYENEETLVCFEKDSIRKNYPQRRTIISRKHKILYNNVFKEAETFINKDTIYEIKYNGEILYNVLLEKHYSMRVHNMICETLHPENKVALFYKKKIKEGLSADEILIQFKKLNV